MPRKTTTSSEVKNRWNAKTYKRYQVSLRKDDDADLIAFVDAVKGTVGVTEIFRLGADQLKKEGH